MIIYNLREDGEPWEKCLGASCCYICLREWLRVVHSLSRATLISLYGTILKTCANCNNINPGIGSGKMSGTVGTRAVVEGATAQSWFLSHGHLLTSRVIFHYFNNQYSPTSEYWLNISPILRYWDNFYDIG